MNWDVNITDNNGEKWLFCVDADTEQQAHQKGKWYFGRQAPRGTIAVKSLATPS